MEVLLARLDNPELATPTIHVAGSKGKGSSSAMIASVLVAAGLRTGLFTSPHLHRMTERIMVDMEEISPDRFSALIEQLWPSVEAVEERGNVGKVSVFEMLTAMAFVQVRSVGADAQVIEVGLGGRLDATNLVVPDVSVITPISLDHTAVLGDTVPKIAFEKAGIIKPGIPVVVGNQAPAARRVIERAARERGSQVTYAHDHMALKQGPEHAVTSGGARVQRVTLQSPSADYKLELPLLGPHQIDNAVTAVTALEMFAARRRLAIDPASIARGISEVRWPARGEVLTSPDEAVQVIVDGAHNSSSAAALVSTLESLFPHAGSAVLVYAGSGGHDFSATAREFSRLEPHVIVTRTRHPKAVAAETVADALRRDNIPVAVVTPDVESAMREARLVASPGDVIIATGSLFVAAEVREILLSITPEIYTDMRGEMMPSYETLALTSLSPTPGTPEIPGMRGNPTARPDPDALRDAP
ncbi:MAG TPA: folylpolyglutamate synthase/dihydrofolate synthase family protein [Dehalococcoidia bacterium]|jgi:dihydrofolate synthase/folylpolyglutamate synthase|nr:bifunctional folylpolyglutamate synthase/dihydrofolate synthase [Chloroflexota bacterium]MDP5877681.1 folylpolyglutamate synthase/dihydrofolate synthase family protein [Dehalococcoidia bacterium]MDP6272713.1 folylpolyglutamate synthase/dihydrofolate synthase family protein [Dehalococcoidia bacterium]MDP7159638.1 folylpolyglutamate synthase/dihydrofolate synthase family protein [Dehalococcoidia bacterium]MDP7213718.1 folylpolyglutamate synthase/dihydrofolate synthase family protein [Dehalococ